MTGEIVPTQLELAITPKELNVRANKLLTEAEQITFGNLPAIIARIIETKAWSKLPTRFDNFGEYALSQSVDGLCIDNNEKLWLLRCAMDADGKHIVEWGDTLFAVEMTVKARPVSERGSREQNRISLETLAKTSVPTRGLTYRPMAVKGPDRDIARIKITRPESLHQIASGKKSRKDMMSDLGIKPSNQRSRLSRAKTDFKSLKPEERTAFIRWLQEEGFS